MSLRVIALGTGVCADTAPAGMVPRQPPGFLVDIDGACLLLDCSEGIRFRLRAAGYDLARIRHVAVSHAHPDHAALPQFIQARFCRQLFGARGTAPDVSIYLPKKLARDFPQVWNWHQPENDGDYWNEFSPEVIGMENGFQVELWPGVVLKAFDVYHGYGRHPAMGFRIETPFGTVAYTGDSGVCPGVRQLAERADLLIADGSTRIGQEYTGGYGHMGPRQCGALAAEAQAKRLWITHWFDGDTKEAMLAEVRAGGFSGEARIAVDGDAWASGV
jgi:ribonuclease BN (tRNA processing enzyme)